MTDLIKINTDGEGIETVDARELHEFLGGKQDFSTWIKGRIKQYSFAEGIDFIQFHNFVESDVKARTEYALTIDMAKELSMVERNEKGRQARKYFIAWEKRGKELEAEKTQPKKIKPPTFSKLASELNGMGRVAKFFGMEGNQARLYANRVVHETYGVNCMEMLQITHIEQEEQEIHLNVSDLGKRIGLTAQKTNKLLEECDLQVSSRNSKKKLTWSPTETGRGFCVIKDTAKKKSDGTPVTQMFWKESTVDFLKAVLA